MMARKRGRPKGSKTKIVNDVVIDDFTRLKEALNQEIDMDFEESLRELPRYRFERDHMREYNDLVANGTIIDTWDEDQKRLQDAWQKVNEIQALC